MTDGCNQGRWKYLLDREPKQPGYGNSSMPRSGSIRMAVRFQYEYCNKARNWFRAYGNENWEVDDDGLMRRREASINDYAIEESDRKFHWPQGPRPADDLLFNHKSTPSALADGEGGWPASGVNGQHIGPIRLAGW
jgi:hypothetical protein